MPRLTAISGLGGKGPACFLVEDGARRLLLDLGEGPQPGLLPDIDAIGRVDAVLLSHQHGDHVGALRFLPRIGAPTVHASAFVGRSVVGAAPSLPLHGASEIAGIAIRTGRSGHAPGGVWIHLAIGNGLLYMGDNCVESPLYAADAPPKAETAILDASYGAYDKPLADCEAAIDLLLADPAQILMPLPAQGRGPEIALHLLRRGVPYHLDDALRDTVAALIATPEIIKPEAMEDLRRLSQAGVAVRDARVVLTSPAPATSALAQRLIAEKRAGGAIRIVFTGYTPPGTPAGDLLENGEAEFLRWNIHPRLSDNAALVRRLKPRRVLPAFGDAAPALQAWRQSFAPAEMIVDGGCAL